MNLTTTCQIAELTSHSGKLKASTCGLPATTSAIVHCATCAIDATILVCLTHEERWLASESVHCIQGHPACLIAVSPFIKTVHL